MAIENLANLASTTLLNLIGSGDTSITVASIGSPLPFPSPNFRIVIDQEIILVTGVSGTIWTVIRGQENTTAIQHNAGSAVTQILTVQGLTNFITQTSPPPDTTNNKNLYNLMSTGLLSGGILTINSGDSTKFDISAGVGYIVNNYSDPLNPTATRITWNTFTGIPDAYLATDDETYIAIDNTGSIYQTNISFTDDQRRDYIIIGFTGHLQQTIINYAISEPAPLIHDVENQLFDFFENFGAFNIDGNVFSANGPNLCINRSAGDTWSFGDNYAGSSKVPNVISNDAEEAIYVNYWQTDFDGNWSLVPTVTNTINPNLLDRLNGTTAVTTGKWTIQTLQYYAHVLQGNSRRNFVTQLFVPS